MQWMLADVARRARDHQRVIAALEPAILAVNVVQRNQHRRQYRTREVVADFRRLAQQSRASDRVAADNIARDQEYDRDREIHREKKSRRMRSCDYFGNFLGDVAGRIIDSVGNRSALAEFRVDDELRRMRRESRASIGSGADFLAAAIATRIEIVGRRLTNLPIVRIAIGVIAGTFVRGRNFAIVWMIFAAEIEFKILASVRLVVVAERSIERMIVEVVGRDIAECGLAEISGKFLRMMLFDYRRRFLRSKFSRRRSRSLDVGLSSLRCILLAGAGLIQTAAATARRPRRLLGIGRTSRGFLCGGNRIRIEHVAASRAFEGRRVIRKNALVNPVPSMTTGALNFRHRPASSPPLQTSTAIVRAQRGTQLARAIISARGRAFRCA